VWRNHSLAAMRAERARQRHATVQTVAWQACHAEPIVCKDTGLSTVPLVRA
jgi:hypothetical protein